MYIADNRSPQQDRASAVPLLRGTVAQLPNSERPTNPHGSVGGAPKTPLHAPDARGQTQEARTEPDTEPKGAQEQRGELFLEV